MVIPVGRALAGPAADAYGADRVLLFSSVMGVVCIGVMLCVPAVRALRRAPKETAEAAVGS